MVFGRGWIEYGVSMAEPLRILFVEDSPFDVELEERELRNAGLAFHSRRVETKPDLIEALSQFNPGLIISDYTLPTMNGLSALEIARKMVPDTPFIFVSGTIGEERAVESLKKGAMDYVVKDRLGGLIFAVQRALKEAQELADERRRRSSPGSGADPAERERERLELRLSEERFLAVVRAASEMIYEWDIEHGTVELRGNIDPKTEYDPSALRRSHQTWEAMLHPEDRPRVLDAVRRHLEGGAPFNEEYRIVRKDGSVRHWIDRGSLLPEYRGLPRKWVGVVTDFTEYRRSERVKEEFVSTISHELRTPLTSIRGALGLINAGTLGQFPEKAKPLLVMAQKNCDRLVRVIDELLDLRSLESGTLELKLTEISGAKLLGQVVEALREPATAQGVNLKVAAEEQDVRIRTDPQRVAQVLSHLLSNAIKFSPKAGTVVVSLTRQGDFARISVSDQGPGIPDEFRDRMFQRFSQADSSATRAAQGTGLGLSISKQVIEAMAGSIGFESVVGKGSTFHVLLPVSMNRMKILIVDDHETVRRFLGRVLKDHGFDVVSIDDGAQAVRAAGAEHPDLILMDLEMPKMSGEEAIRALKADPATSSIPVIVLTALSTPEAVATAIRAGARDFVVKADVRIDEFIARVRKGLSADKPGAKVLSEPPGAQGASAKESGPRRKGPGRSILSRERVEAHLRDSVELKALPFVAAEVLKIASTPNADVGQLSQTLARDPALSATILQLSNSAFFTAQTRVQGLNQAIMRLGLPRVGEIVTAIKLIEEFRGGGRKSGIDRLEMWLHALAVAVLARDLASAGKQPPGVVEGAFLAGLLHDLGQAYLADHFPAPYGKVLALASKQGVPLHEVERDVCGIDHAEVAERILSKWKLHPDLIDAVAQHAGVADSAGLRPIVWLANILARTARIGTDGDQTIDLVPDDLVVRMGLDGDRVEHVLAGAEDQVRQLSEILLLHPHGATPATSPPLPLREHIQAAVVVQTPRLVDPLELLLKNCRWNVRRVSALGEVAGDPAVQALLVRPRTSEWLREQLDQAADEGAKELKGRRPLVICAEGAFPRELKGLLRSLGGEAVGPPLSISRLIQRLENAGDRR